jgi:hypothetical protein
MGERWRNRAAACHYASNNGAKMKRERDMMSLSNLLTRAWACTRGEKRLPLFTRIR